VRIVAATHRDLRAEVDAGRFRADLFYRLAVLPLEVPPLRDRPEDIPLIAAHLLERLLVQAPGDLERLRAHLDVAFAELVRYPWPGNVRELRNVIERAAALADPAALRADVFTRLVSLQGAIGQTLHVRPPLEQARAHFDREYLRDVLEAAQGDLARAAELADVHPKSLARLMRRHGVTR
jgi:DNA-binding NtrC family response regulator